MGLVKQGMQNSKLSRESDERKGWSDDKTYAEAARIKIGQLEKDVQLYKGQVANFSKTVGEMGKELKELRFITENIPKGILDSWRRAYKFREDIKILIKHIESLPVTEPDYIIDICEKYKS